ncbi:N-acetylneuraminate synthase [Syntrophotalea acetylenivorans]|uniref:N-acetylneuraminate synthase n=1 Tax=Syntrophotalea acetylenivorans TaxID=1842532 RepID=A0A1L3GN66_9BACT|nr:N-acetylneuraminate synthase [Syntrophotalea acetylenivorans]APG27351.1 N-acetylneuraminate synthase [Syntrophotalea acetylenivorans]
MPREIVIGNRPIGADHSCFIIAEAGVNHNGDLYLARGLIEAAQAAGADAVKFQTFTAERLVSANAPKAAYQMRSTDVKESQFTMIKRLELSPAHHHELLEYCHKLGILFLSSPFDEQSADFLDDLGLPAFKIPSGEVVNLPFLAHVARKGKPIILSTGMATLSEVEAAVETIRTAGNPPLVLLQCVSNYPADPRDVNLRAMKTLSRAFDVPVGYSDHVAGNEISFGAAALGACVIEKHFTLNRQLPGPDHQASLEPDDLCSLVAGIRAVESALGDGCKRPAVSEKNTASVARKSLVAACDIEVGAVIEESMVAVKRPGTGLAPDLSNLVVGRTALVAIPRDSLLRLEDLA